MMLVACTECGCALNVVGDLEELSTLIGDRSDFWPDHYVCFNCGRPCQCYLTPEASPLALAKMHVVALTPQEAFAALNGFGVPAEQTCCPEVVMPHFMRLGIQVKGGQPSGRKFFRIEELTFPDGTTLFLAPSPMGAVVYRVRPHMSYLEKVEAENADG
jgi:hypothetical protein